ncbi:MAG: hypothetical protein JST48_09460 [Bacteroidetes bacterium]|nr:hypothetical protein [Bacteroidota bacterium]
MVRLGTGLTVTVMANDEPVQPLADGTIVYVTVPALEPVAAKVCDRL